MRGLIVVGGLLLAGSLIARTQTPEPRVTRYEGIPAGFDFPADEAILLKARDAGDVRALRKHAWLVFAGLTSPAKSGEAIWETWFTGNQTFASSKPAESVRPFNRSFGSPLQFDLPEGGPDPHAAGASLLAATLFNQEAYNHIRANEFHLPARLTQINDSFSRTTPIEQRQIVPFTRASVALKTVWWVVKRNELTALPVWDPILNPQPNSAFPYPEWPRVVAVDAGRTRIPDNETATVTLLGKPRTGARVVSLNRFYSFRIDTEAERKSVIASSAPNASKAEKGDYVALTAMHYTTKEIPDWVWATFWWHDRPDAGPFAANRPPQVRDVWKNYLMATTYSMDTPKEQNGSPPICFNPWLEARFVDGVNSNCMACHQLATWPPGDHRTVVRGSQPQHRVFIDATKLDFMWSIAKEKRQ